MKRVQISLLHVLYTPPSYCPPVDEVGVFSLNSAFHSLKFHVFNIHPDSTTYEVMKFLTGSYFKLMYNKFELSMETTEKTTCESEEYKGNQQT